MLADLAIESWEQNDHFKHLHVKNTFFLAVNNTKHLSLVTQLHRCTSWEPETSGWRQRKNPTAFQPYKVCFKREKWERAPGTAKAFCKKNSLVGRWKSWNQGLPGARSVTGLEDWTNNVAPVGGVCERRLPNPGFLLPSSEEKADRNEFCWTAEVLWKVHVAVTKRSCFCLFLNTRLSFPWRSSDSCIMVFL